jgi:hypothetical protein
MKNAMMRWEIPSLGIPFCSPCWSCCLGSHFMFIHSWWISPFHGVSTVLSSPSQTVEHRAIFRCKSSPKSIRKYLTIPQPEIRPRRGSFGGSRGHPDHPPFQLLPQLLRLILAWRPAETLEMLDFWRFSPKNVEVPPTWCLISWIVS